MAYWLLYYDVLFFISYALKYFYIENLHNFAVYVRFFLFTRIEECSKSNIIVFGPTVFPG